MTTTNQIKIALEAASIPSELASKIADNYKPCYQLLPLGDENYSEVGNSRAGGLPDLPIGVDWPLDSNGTGLYFVAQVNLADLPDQHQVIPFLPKRGLLYFFINQWSWQDNRVIYFDGELSTLRKAEIDTAIFEKEPLNAPVEVCKIDFEFISDVKLSLDYFTTQEVDDF